LPGGGKGLEKKDRGEMGQTVAGTKTAQKLRQGLENLMGLERADETTARRGEGAAGGEGKKKKKGGRFSRLGGEFSEGERQVGPNDVLGRGKRGVTTLKPLRRGQEVEGPASATGRFKNRLLRAKACNAGETGEGRQK